ncbi:MAG: hypothetical protein ACW98K_17865 [Candidatus Kariarchaeaceae archaeon]
MQESTGKPPFVKNVDHDIEISHNTPIRITLNADWPTPSWSHEKTDIDIDESSSTVIISYLGSRRPGVAMQALKSFSAEFEVKLPSKGQWTLVVRGRSEDWESRIKVV